MIVFRTCHKKFIHQLDGRGGLIVEGRWHTKGHETINTSISMALSLLEVFKLHNLDIIPANFCGVELHFPDIEIETFPSASLPKRWNNPLAYMNTLQKYGDEWLLQKRALVLKVPSASDSNYLINPNHPKFDAVSIIRSYELIVENGYLVMPIVI